ncbi:MAG TPA: acyclic terpene utilization AtuA family protein [Alphaproteobacteria bacterium]|jgi:hypothetical protein|nr:DUF1446 domain-containing protein [Alphaproteobacteria bacterium]MDP6269814.1 DUF1446 domain-containing protein [Alphaproteobacteria bacterium]MDP7163725.1 DUF1446 domain-containing protein [Alphaproteobacteria bacterium]HJM50206.1 acyclic terpene utilization AtuA family protein [Alphaproteobacteria bacterium]
MAKDIVRIGGAAGFWGDTNAAPVQLVEGGKLDYVVFDYLAEVTMSILARAKAKNADAGYAIDFIQYVMPAIVRPVAEQGIRVIANAGGMNSQACAEAVRKIAAEAGVSLKVAVVLGDDLMPRLDEVRALGPTEWASGEALPEKLASMNAYLGAFSIAEALADGADVVITGRVVDSAVTLAALIHEFDWQVDDYDLLAAGSLCGHILECGTQATGGNHTDWQLVPGWDDMGYPIAECKADGSFVLSKVDGTGGLITPGTVGEQMLYEIGDPRAYLLPDVSCDFTAVTMTQAGENRVAVSGARGRPPSATYKVSATYMDGFRCATSVMLGGRDAAAKARRTGEAIFERTRRMFRERNLGDYRETRIETFGAEEMYGAQTRAGAAREIVLKVSARHDQKEALDLYSLEIAQAALGAAPGISVFQPGRARPQPVIRLFSFLIDKAAVPVEVDVEGESRPSELATDGGFDPASLPDQTPALPESDPEDPVTVPLIALAYGRSGDKGNHANIGLVARDPEFLPWINRAVTEAAVAEYFEHYLEGNVVRYQLPGIHGLNFMLLDALGGGGIASLRTDPQGKAYAQMLLDLPVSVPRALAEAHELPQEEAQDAA